MKITLLHVPDCPNLLEARRNVDQALATVGMDAEVTECEVRSADNAVRAGMNGSPTILIDGNDLFVHDASGSLACRLYRDTEGVHGAPSVAGIIDKLAS